MARLLRPTASAAVSVISLLRVPVHVKSRMSSASLLGLPRKFLGVGKDLPKLTLITGPRHRPEVVIVSIAVSGGEGWGGPIAIDCMNTGAKGNQSPGCVWINSTVMFRHAWSPWTTLRRRQPHPYSTHW